MSRILGDPPFVLAFIDDIVNILTKSRGACGACQNSNWTDYCSQAYILNRDKCNFFLIQISLLGFVIGLHGKSVDPTKFANIDEWAAPTTFKQIMSFVGTLNFFLEFIPLFSLESAPLDALQSRTVPFTLNKEQMQACNTLKNLLTHGPILSFPDFSKPFYVDTDASDLGVEAVLYQLPKGEILPNEINHIAFMARSLQQWESENMVRPKMNYFA